MPAPADPGGALHFFGSRANFLHGMIAVNLFVIVLALMTLFHLHQEARQRTVMKTQYLAQSVEQSFDRLLGAIDMAMLSSARVIGAQLSSGKLDQPFLSGLLHQQKELLPQVEFLRVTDEKGDVLFGPDGRVSPYNLGDRDFFIQLRNEPQAGLVLSKPVIGRADSKWIWPAGRRISKTDGSFAGMVFGRIRLDEIAKSFAALHLESGSSIALRGADMELIARYQSDGQNPIPTGDRQLAAAFVQARQANPDQGTYVSDGSGLDPAHRIYSYQRNQRYGFTINVGLTGEVELDGWRKQAFIIVNLLALFVMASVFFSWLISRTWKQQVVDMVALTASRRSLHEAQQIAHLGHYSYDVRSRSWTTSDILDAILGWKSSGVSVAGDLTELVVEHEREEMRSYLRGLEENKNPLDRELQIVRPNDGLVRWLHVHGRIQSDAGGSPQTLIGTIQDITDRKRAERSLRIAATAFEAQEGMMITDEKNVIIRVNRAFSTITGYGMEEVVGQTPGLLSSGRHDAAFFEEMKQSVRVSGAWQGEIWNRRKSGEIFPMWLTITAVKDEQGQVANYVSTLTDISERKQAELDITSLAFYDPLTGLPNRRLLRDRLQQALISSARSERDGALMFLDLDNFKNLNDSLGHDIGDLLLQQVARRLLDCVRECDTVARLGGDEFVVMLEELGNGAQESATLAKAVGLKIMEALDEPYQLGHHRSTCTPSIGITLFSGHLESIDELMKQADLAMYRAKTEGRNTLRFYDPAMQSAVNLRVEMEASLRQALDQGQFMLYYQAQVDAAGQTIGAEALARWQHPERGLVKPGEFIPMAEETGLILPLGQWVLEQACMQLTNWSRQARLTHLTVSVNVSARQFHHPDFVVQLQTVLSQTGADPARLKLELTESMLLENTESVVNKMKALKDMGVGLSLDDFGTGYSSLSYLKQLPLDQLKIDLGFVRDILVDENDAAIAKTIIALAESFGLNVLAEGVETQAQRDFLAQLGCHTYQGYWFGRPQPPAAFEAMMLKV